MKQKLNTKSKQDKLLALADLVFCYLKARAASWIFSNNWVINKSVRQQRVSGKCVVVVARGCGRHSSWPRWKNSWSQPAQMKSDWWCTGGASGVQKAFCWGVYWNDSFYYNCLVLLSSWIMVSPSWTDSREMQGCRKFNSFYWIFTLIAVFTNNFVI